MKQPSSLPKSTVNVTSDFIHNGIQYKQGDTIRLRWAGRDYVIESHNDQPNNRSTIQSDLLAKHTDKPLIEIIKAGIKSGNTFMGDRMIGFKFIGDNSKVLNEQLMAAWPEDFIVTEDHLNEYGIIPVACDTELWKTGIL